MFTLIFATNNKHKVEEIRNVIRNNIQIITLKEAGIDIDIPEPYNTLEENAIAKASTIHAMTELNCFSEDTGLEVLALNGEPGVKSARYAGEEKEFKANIDKLLLKMQNIENRSAHFRTVIALIWEKEKYLFEGICEGRIIEQKQGTNGFGYDPIFIPAGSKKTFAEMTLEEKNKYSHRKKAVEKLLNFLKEKIK